ncbi:MAG: bifunctional glutamate N-acetyltransferase/amino-acid acetyltransferase ArgJ [Oscillospiraceae bacterium]|jgi:glutamate N-acetyltransferase/amino-acid N-acetyltransferase|nr:bifunctional glutamate N-acetyltransferase/amino-acid acetyltransferase ArgJ [Oscillospiraceae bacterium]
MDFASIAGGVCAPRGFKANGVHCGIRANRSKADLALIVSDVPASAAAIYTQNLVKGAPLSVTKQHILDGKAQAVVCNSGNANTCNANGIEIAEGMAALVEQATGIAASDVIVASTGVIGEPLSLAPIETGMPVLVAGLSAEGANAAAQAIMTTDTVRKEAAAEFFLGGKACRLGGMAKGSGMIHPNMATMLCFVTSDVAIAPGVLQAVLQKSADATLNMITVDGDTSTNDMCCVLANGLAGNEEIRGPGADCDAFAAALTQVMQALAKLLAGDGEGATKRLECHVAGAKDLAGARAAAKGVVGSSLFKAAMFGADANWGRVLCALGYCGAELDITKVAVDFVSAAGRVSVCKNGAGVPFSEAQAKQVLRERAVRIEIALGDGTAEATAWGCDLTYDYVKINGDYRT